MKYRPKDEKHQVIDAWRWPEEKEQIPLGVVWRFVWRFEEGVNALHQKCGHGFDGHGWIRPALGPGAKKYEGGDGQLVCPGMFVCRGKDDDKFPFYYATHKEPIEHLWEPVAEDEKPPSLQPLCRDVVIKFAQAMEDVLCENDHKGGWDKCALPWLGARLVQEVGELLEEIHNETGEELVLREAADVANFAMMIWDRSRQRKEARK